MTTSNIEELSNVEDYFSAKSNISDISQSYESLNKQMDINELDSKEMLLRISNLQDKRYDATYKISELKRKIAVIEKQEMAIMKESTIQHSNLQENYVINYEEENFIKKLTEQAAVRLGKMKFELKTINEQVQVEQEKLEELEEQSERLTARIASCNDESADCKSDLRVQLAIIDEQRDQQAKIFEDLEFKELETQSKFEEESESLKSNIIEAQRKFIMSTRTRDNRKLYYDEQQILLMKNTRKNLDKLESERNCCNQQIAHYQVVLNSCSEQIEEFNRSTNKINLTEIVDQSWNKSNNSEAESCDVTFISNFESIANGELLGPSYVPSCIGISGNNSSLQDRLDSLTEIVKMNLNLPGSKRSELSPNVSPPSRLTPDWMTGGNSSVNNMNNGCSADSLYPSRFSLSDDTESLSLARDDMSSFRHRSKKPPAVTFECVSIEESSSSNQSPVPDFQTQGSRTDSIEENNDENSHPDLQMKGSVVRRNKEKYSSKRSKQLRPLTCFLPKIHSNFNLMKHVESCGHDLTVCGDHVQIDHNSCQGFLWKLSNRLFGVWKKRWFYFDHNQRQLKYYNSKSKSKVQGSIDFQNISDVFVDHTHRARNPQKLTLCIETQAKSYYLFAAKPELVTLWVDVIFTGAEAYLTLHHPSMINSIISQSAE